MVISVQKIIFLSIMFCSFLSSCETDNPKTNTKVDHIKNFGFTLVDTYWDDPSDNEVKSNYADEVASFSNVADMIPASPSDNMLDRMKIMDDLDLGIILHLHDNFFEYLDDEAPSGVRYSLRGDYQERWDELALVNLFAQNAGMFAALYVGEEPTWNGITKEDLAIVCNFLKDRFPFTPVMIVEAYPAIADLVVPESADWIGFDHYFIKDPSTDNEFQAELALLKTKFVNNQQKIVLIMDTHYISEFHGDFGNIALGEMKDVANNYYDLARADSSIVTILGYFWPSGFDATTSIGARDMPDEVLEQYKAIGKEITGK